MTTLDRLRYIAYRAFPAGYPVLLLATLSTGFAIWARHWTMWALAAAFALIVVGFALVVALTERGAVYTVGPVRVVWQDGYQPPDAYREFLDEWWARWADYADREGWTRAQLLDGVTLHVVAELDVPQVDDGEVVIASAYGATWPVGRVSRVVTDGATRMGVAGHELDLQAAHVAWGQSSEGIDIERLREEGIT